METWTDQLDYFEHVVGTPSFAAIYQSLRELLLKEWGRYEGYRFANTEPFHRPKDKPHLAKYFDVTTINLSKEKVLRTGTKHTKRQIRKGITLVKIVCKV